jgi:benzoate-CoA ligase
MPALSSAEHSLSPPRIDIPREYNAAHDLIERNLQAGRAGKIAVIDDRGSYTYAQLAERVNRFANVLGSLGVQMEQRVLLCLLDTIDFPIAFLGSIKAGVVPIAVNTLLAPADFEYMLNDSRACTLVVSAQMLQAFSALLPRARFLRHVIVCGGDSGPYRSFDELLGHADTEYECAPTTCDDMCFWLYSSGSTGSPKGTVHVHASMVQTAELYARGVAGYREDDVVFSASKLPFAYGLGNSLSFPMAVGATAVLMAERPTPAAIIDRLLKHQPTIFCTVPTVYAALLASPALPAREALRLRCCTSAGEALPEEVGKRWSRHFGVDILDGIGSTEMLHIFLSNRPGDVRYGTTGKPVPGYEVRIVDEDGRVLPPEQSGELQIRGPTCAMLYWNNRVRSCSTFQGPWLRSGDKYRQRHDGYFVYEGRSDDMLKVAGLYVSPVEVESALIEHETVLEAAVVGREDESHLVKPMAFVVLKPGHDASASVAQALQEHVKGRLAPYKYPRWIEFVNELPKTPTGKIQRFKLREAAAALR